jgi:hypothetical protein
MYVGIRLLFIYADSGYRPEPQGGQLECTMGPDCYYARLVDAGEGDRLAEEGIRDAASLEQAVWTSQGEWLLILTGLTLAGALLAAGWRAVRTPPGSGGLAGASPGSSGPTVTQSDPARSRTDLGPPSD